MDSFTDDDALIIAVGFDCVTGIVVIVDADASDVV